MEKECKIKAPREWEVKVIQLFIKFIHRLNSTTSGFSGTFDSVSIHSPGLLWVQTQAPKLNLIVPVGENSCTPQAVSSISSHIAPHYLCQAEIKGFGQQMKTVPTAAHCTGRATPSNSSWKQPRETISCSSTFPCTLWCRQRHCADLASNRTQQGVYG